MKLNIFQKIEFLIYISIIIFICVYFVPYQEIRNGFRPGRGSYNINSSYHSNILNEGYGSMIYFRFLIYLAIPTLFFYFIYKYLEKNNSLELSTYKKKGKRELNIFFLFGSIILGTVLFLYVNNHFKLVNYNNEEIESNIVFAFLASFLLLYIIRPLFSMFKGMLLEVNQNPNS